MFRKNSSHIQLDLRHASEHYIQSKGSNIEFLFHFSAVTVTLLVFKLNQFWFLYKFKTFIFVFL